MHFLTLISCRIIQGHSVWCHFHGFEPYFYIKYSPRIPPDNISRFHRTLEVILSSMSSYCQNYYACYEWSDSIHIGFRVQCSHSCFVYFSASDNTDIAFGVHFAFETQSALWPGQY
ncbi:hypothetical protein D8674_034613 [Pyrus ussuriensis x Pyrus communis]|uniref:DNA-directed DNA polymerase family B exonuclease domain-containing protein n=1 Tax=Pyrus ussuriensis x Pyrus communis TaxID=2448454 RepID=A0A5N5GAV9_9ROSA|nr:hypothetical protein D8674_034613 [Pyrus ussuriensis x Pyrus communis]